MSADKSASIPSGCVLGVSCGGTGGHFYPGLTIARQYQRQGGKVILFVGGRRASQQIEAAKEHGLEAVEVPVVQPPRSKLGLPLFVLQLLGCAWKTAGIVKQHKVKIGLSMGSYTSVPFGLGMRLAGKPFYIHEGNAILGRANRLLSRFARHILLSLPIPELLSVDRASLVGMPVRDEILAAKNADRTDAEELAHYQQLGLSPDFPVVLVFGGSQGARAINETLMQAIPEMTFPQWQLVHMTGQEENEEEIALCKAHEVPAIVQARTDKIGTYLAVADLVVSRAGGSTISELAIMGRPSILVPYPHAMDDHQSVNASVVVQAKGGAVIKERKLSPACLAQRILATLADPAERRAQSEGIETLAHPRAAEDIVSLLVREVQSQEA